MTFFQHFLHVLKQRWNCHAKKHFFCKWFSEFCTFLCMKQLDTNILSVCQFVLKCVKCVAWHFCLIFSRWLKSFQAPKLAAGSTCSITNPRPSTETRWHSQRVAWKPLYFHPVENRCGRKCIVCAQSCMNLWHNSSVWWRVYLLAGFYEFINSHHSISVPIHFLKNVRHEKD